MVLPVHDELICEVPIDNWEEGGRILSQMMCDAANFLPFPSGCDVTTTLRWYGLEYPCAYPRPTSALDNLSEDEIKWVQYHLIEMEYKLPIFPNPDGSELRGDATHGVNGIVSNEYDLAIASYRAKYHLTSDEEFYAHIERKVRDGV